MLLRSNTRRLYDPEDRASRQELASLVTDRLKGAGFKLLPSHGEDVYQFQHRKDPGLRVLVYTSIWNGEMRLKAKDAIRVVVLYDQKRNREKKTVPLHSLPIVKRSPKSTVQELVERVVDRARDAYRFANEVDRCHKCTAPIAISKAGKPYCAEICWEQ